MITQSYPFTDEQADRIVSSLRKYHAKIAHRTNKVWFEYVDLDHVLSTILTGAMPAAVVDDAYLVMYDHGTPWYNPNITVLEEVMVIKIAPGGSFDNVVAFLQSKGRLHNASLVSVGTALAMQDDTLAGWYERHGFQVSAHQLVKPL